MVTRKALAAYIAASFITTILFLADFANTYRAFYPAMVALANSYAFRVMTVNAVIAGAMLLWFTMQFVFFGKLNASEETALLTSFTIYLAECIIVPLYFNLTLMSTTMVFFTFTLVWRLMHKLAAERVTTLSTVQLTLFPVTRMVAYLNFALIGDVGFLLWLIQTRPDLKDEKASLHYSLLLIYMLLVTSTLRSAVRFGSLFVLHGQHTLLSFVADAATSIAESLLFVGVYAYIFMKSTLPLLLLRSFISHALRIFEKASGLAEFLMLARKVRHDMPNATTEDLARDARCTICYEDMVPGGGTKRLPCGHCYHTACLEHWLEGHSTCPYCRADIMRMRNTGNGNEGVAEAATAQAEDRPAGGADAAGVAARATGEDAAQQQQQQSQQHPDTHLLPPPFMQELNEYERQQIREHLEREAKGPFAVRLRCFMERHAATNTPEAAEEELQAAYQRYLSRVDPTNPACSPEEQMIATITEQKATVQRSQSSSCNSISPPPAASATASTVARAPPTEYAAASPLQSPTLLSNDASIGAASTATPQRSAETVEQLKLKAYKCYHKRLREAEKELLMALKHAEESGTPT